MIKKDNFITDSRSSSCGLSEAFDLPKMSRGPKVDPQSWRSDEAWYSLITILRMLKLRGKKREIANNMEDHLKTWKENENFRCKLTQKLTGFSLLTNSVILKSLQIHDL